MLEFKILLKNYEDIEAFSNIINERDYDIFLVSGNSKVNAKSLLGVYCLDLSNPVVLQADTDNDPSLAEALASFMEK